MITLEQEIEDLKKKHAQLEIDQYNEKLQKKYDKLKKLEGTVEVRMNKTSKTTRFASIVYHIEYSVLKDEWKKNQIGENYIGMHTKLITILESPRAPYKNYKIETNEITPKSYNGRIDVKDESSYYDYSTKKLLSVEEFNLIWGTCKNVSKNILDGILNIKEIKWLMNGTDEDFEFKSTEISEYQKISLDIPHIVLSTEESWKLNNKYCNLFLNHNIYLITPNSLYALDEWLKYEIKSDSWSSQACASVGESWRGSRVDEYKKLVSKIKVYKS